MIHFVKTLFGASRYKSKLTAYKKEKKERKKERKKDWWHYAPTMVTLRTPTESHQHRYHQIERYEDRERKLTT